MKKIFPIIIFPFVLAACGAPGNEATQTETANDSIQNAPKRAIKVETRQVQPQEFISYFEVIGNVEAIEDAFISPETNGQIKKIHVERGARVTEGQRLVTLNTDVTRKNIQELKTSLELTTKIYQKQKELWNQNIGSEIQFLEAKNGKEVLEARLATLESQLDMSLIEAPFDGIIEEIMVKEGELASPGMRLLRIVNLSELRIHAQVSESFLGNIHTGDSVNIFFEALPQIEMVAPVSRLGSVIDPLTRTFTVEVNIDNQDEQLKPNMISSLRVQDYVNPEALVVPSIIIKEDFDGSFLFRVRKNGDQMEAEKVYVKPGNTIQDQTEIAEGIASGDQVIIKGFNLVSDGTGITIAK